MSNNDNCYVTEELLKQVVELDGKIRKLKKERDDMFYIPARKEIIERMQQHGMNELLLVQKDETTGGWKWLDDAPMFFNDDHEPSFFFEDGDISYRIIRFGIIDGKLKMRLQEMPEDLKGPQESEIEDWISFDHFYDFELLYMLLGYIYFSLDIYKYTSEHPELLVLGK